jgi:hypothetical protein
MRIANTTWKKVLRLVRSLPFALAPVALSWCFPQALGMTSDYRDDELGWGTFRPQGSPTVRQTPAVVVIQARLLATLA